MQIPEITAELTEYKKKLQSLLALQEQYKEINKAFTLWKKNPSTLDSNKKLTEHSKDVVRNWQPKYSFETRPIQGWQLTNVNARIKDTQKRIEVIESKQRASVSGNQKHQFESSERHPKGDVVVNFELDRLQIDFEEKPNKAMLDTLKSYGYNWSPTYGIWQRKLTNDAIYRTNQLLALSMPNV